MTDRKRLLYKLSADLDAAREERGMTVRGVASAAGLDKGAISRLLAAKREPMVTTLLAVATVLDVRVVLEAGEVRVERRRP